MYILERPARIIVLSNSKKNLSYAEKRLENFKDIDVIMATTSLFQVEHFLKTNHAPDVILFDLPLQNKKSIQTIKDLKQINSKMRILLFTDFYGTEEISNALSVGAYSVCSKEGDDEELISAINSVSVGACWFDKRVSKSLLNFFALGEIQRERFKKEEEIRKNSGRNIQLTPREKEVLRCIVLGMNNPQIAERLITTIHTTKAHICSIYQKLCVTDRVQAAVIALQEKLI